VEGCVIIQSYNFDVDFVMGGHTSKGYAEKFNIDGYWYKVNSVAFNSQAEAACSKLLALSNIEEYVDYELCMVNGCYATKSKDWAGSIFFSRLTIFIDCAVMAIHFVKLPSLLTELDC
jgi:hypothetical protein